MHCSRPLHALPPASLQADPRHCKNSLVCQKQRKLPFKERKAFLEYSAKQPKAVLSPQHRLHCAKPTHTPMNQPSEIAWVPHTRDGKSLLQTLRVHDGNPKSPCFQHEGPHSKCWPSSADTPAMWFSQSAKQQEMTVPVRNSQPVGDRLPMLTTVTASNPTLMVISTASHNIRGCRENLST